MAKDILPTTIRISQETYQQLSIYADTVLARDISSAVRFFILTFLEDPEKFPNIEIQPIKPKAHQTTIAIDTDIINSLKQIASIRNVSLAYLLRLIIYYGLKDS